MGLGAAGAAAAIGAAGSIGGAAINASSASGAASKSSAQSYAALLAQQVEQNNNTVNYQPYLNAGVNASQRSGDLIDGYSGAIQPYQNALLAAVPQGMTEANLVQTPGYQFNLSQGLQATQSSAAARGLGVSGAALKGAASYATGLADSTYQQQFANQQTKYQDASNNLTQALSSQNQLFNQNQSIAQLGSVNAANSANNNLGFAAQANNLVTGAANAQTAGAAASSNALTSGINGVANAATGYSNNQLLQGILANNGSMYTTPASTQLPQSDNTTAGLTDYSLGNLLMQR